MKTKEPPQSVEAEKKSPTVEWYRCKLDKETLKALNTRSDLKGFLQAGGYLTIVVATGGLSIGAWYYEWWFTLLCALYLHGTVCAFMINGIHELVHGTVFKTRWLNPVFANIFAFLSLHNHHLFWASHTLHHKYTLHPPDDLEVVLPIRFSLKGMIENAIFNPMVIKSKIKEHWNLSRGTFEGEWARHITKKESVRREVIAWSRFLWLGHGVICLVSLYFGWWIIPVVLTLSQCYGRLLFFFCNNTQHVGLQDHVPDFRLNSRTFLLNPVVRFLYWQMNYHIEHHMYAGVPCYHLEKLHKTIRHELPTTPDGLVETWFEIIGILWRQSKEPDYQYIPALPETHFTGDKG